MSSTVESEHRAVHLLSPQTVMQLKTLELRAQTVVEGFLSGLHRSPYFGFSVEFSEYRQYVPGDDVRHIDWKLFGRTDRLHIKQFQDETNVRCYFLLDASASMAFGSLGFSKHEYAETLVASLSLLLAEQRDAIGLVVFDEAVRKWIPARYTRSQARRLWSAMQTVEPSGETSLGAVLETLAGRLRRRSLVVLVSDFLDPHGEHLKQLEYLCALGQDVIVFHIADRREIDFAFPKPAEFQDAETGQRLLVDPQRFQAEYCRAFEEHRRQLEKTCAELGLSYIFTPTDRPLELMLVEFLHRRARRQRLARTRAPRAAGA